MHGAVAAGLYGAIVSGPQIGFQSGSNGYEISIVSPAELGGSNSASVTPVTSQVAVKLPEPRAEVSLRPIAVRTLPKREAATPPQEARARLASPVTEATSRNGVTTGSECLDGACTRAENGARMGGSGVSSIGVLEAPKPPYPWEARRLGFEGKVVVAVDIGKDGYVQTAQLAQTSGRDDCDRSALDTIRERWRFEPARRDGEPIDWRENVIVVYSLR